MFPTFAHVAAYPLVFPLFYGAVVVFAVVHGPAPADLRRRAPIAAVRERSAPGRRPRGIRPGPAQDVPRPSGRAAPRGDLLGLRAPDRRHGQHRDGWTRPGRHRGAVRRGALDGPVRAPERRRRHRPRVDRLGVRTAPHLPAGAADVHPRCPDHPGDDRWGRGDRAAGPGRRGGPIRRRPRRLHRGPPGGPPAEPRPEPRRGALRRAVVEPHRARRRVPRLPPVQQAPPHRHELPQHLPAQARPARRAAGHGPRGRGRHVRPADAPGPGLEGPPRRLHVHRVRPLHGGLPGQLHRQAAQPQGDDHGHPPHVHRGRARPQLHPQQPARPRDVRARRPGDARPSRQADRGRRDPLRRGLGLRDLRRLRRGLPGPHRARRQDRGPAAEPRPRGEPLPPRS